MADAQKDGETFDEFAARQIAVAETVRRAMEDKIKLFDMLRTVYPLMTELPDPPNVHVISRLFDCLSAVNYTEARHMLKAYLRPWKSSEIPAKIWDFVKD